MARQPDHVRVGARSRDERRVENEYVFKSMNRQYEHAVASHAQVGDISRVKLDFYCECSDLDCIADISITAGEYEAIHAHPHRFVVLPGHTQLDIEAVVAQQPAYVIVQKRAETDPNQ